MPDWLSVILLGLIEGVTEFLPVSSTGHLLLAEHWLGARSDLFNVVIQAGAVVAVLAVFRVRVQELLSQWRRPENLSYLAKLGVAFVLTAIGGLVMKKLNFRLPKTVPPIAWATLVGGILFLVVEAFIKGKPRVEQVSWTVALAVAAGQLVAIAFPGASRSGTTILFALILGLSRSAAAEFSFLLGIPTLLAAAAKETLDALKDRTPHESWALLALGTVVSAIAAFTVVHWLLGYVRHRDFRPFGWYRILVGGAILLFLK